MKLPKLTRDEALSIYAGADWCDGCVLGDAHAEAAAELSPAARAYLAELGLDAA